MARKKAAAKGVVSAMPEPQEFAGLNPVDVAFATAMHGVATQTGPGLYFTSPHVVNVGIPFPALCLRYLFKSTVFPVGRFSQLAGEEGAGKSMFLTEMFRWVMSRNGYGFLAENEYKEYSELRNSIFWWNTEFINRLKVVQTVTVEEWQTSLTRAMASMRQIQDTHGKRFPFMLAVDSLMSTLTQGDLAKIAENGYAETGYAKATQTITKYVRSLGWQMRGYPFLVVVTNHLRQQISQGPPMPGSGPLWQSGGGKSAKYNETFEIWLKRIKDIRTTAYNGMAVSFKVHKSSFGQSRDEILAEVLWWTAPSDPQDPNSPPRQITYWDWHTATIDMILKFANTDGKKTLYSHMIDLLELESINSSQRTAISRKIMGDKKPYEFRQIAARLEEPDHFQLMHEVHRLLKIREDITLPVGQDYGVYLAEAMRRTEIETQQALQAATAQPVTAADLTQPHEAVAAVEPGPELEVVEEAPNGSE